MIGRLAAGGLSAASLLAVALGAPASAVETKTFHSADWGVTLSYPADLVASRTFKANFMDRGAWRVSYAADTGPGERIFALSLPDIDVNDEGGSGKATAELRFGASRDPAVVATCLTYGMNSGNNVETRHRTIGGVAFTEVPDNSDGEMSKAIRTDDLRAVHKGACWAIDLVVYVEGTSNARPDYSEARLDRLRGVLSHLTFD